MASYAGAKTCRGFEVPSGVALAFYPFISPSLTKQQWKENAINPYGYGSRVALLAARMGLQFLGSDASPPTASITYYDSGRIAAHPMLRKFDDAHEAEYQRTVDDEGEGHAESIDYYEALEQAVDGFDAELAGVWTRSRTSTGSEGATSPPSGTADSMPV